MTTRQDIKLSLLMAKLIHRIIILDRDEKACQGVTLSQHYTIDAIYRKRALTMNELSQELNLAISTLTRIIDVLVRDRLVRRKTDKTDRRKVVVELTETGEKKAKHLRECTQLFWTNIIKTIPNEKKSDLVHHVKLLLQAMQNIEGTCLTKQASSVSS